MLCLPPVCTHCAALTPPACRLRVVSLPGISSGGLFGAHPREHVSGRPHWHQLSCPAPSGLSHLAPNKKRCHCVGAAGSSPPVCSPALSLSCSQCQQGCSNKQVAYFAINMHEACFNIQRLKQQHCFLQLSTFVTDRLLKLGESLSFLPVSPDSICQALIFFSLLPAELEINNFCFILSLVYHWY